MLLIFVFLKFLILQQQSGDQVFYFKMLQKKAKSGSRLFLVVFTWRKNTFASARHISEDFTWDKGGAEPLSCCFHFSVSDKPEAQ